MLERKGKNAMHYQLIEAPLIRGERDSVMFLEGRHVPIVAPFVTKLYIKGPIFFRHYHEPIGRQTLDTKKNVSLKRTSTTSRKHIRNNRAPIRISTWCIFVHVAARIHKRLKEARKRSFVVSGPFD